MSSNSLHQAQAMYRRCLRMVKLMEGQRRRRLCAFRTKEMISRALKARNDEDEFQKRLMEADIYLDQAQATHLRHLADDPRKVLIPLALYQSNNERKVLLDSLPGRRLDDKEKHGDPTQVLGGRLFQGPEPSWLRKEKQQPEEESMPRIRKRQ